MSDELRGASPASARRALVLSAAGYTPVFLAGVVLTVLSIIGIVDAGRVLTFIEAIVTLLFAYQSIQSLRDLGATPVRTEGVVGRKWSKMDFIINRSHYIAIGRGIFRLPVEDWYDLSEGDRLGILHYPHTGTVAGVERLGFGGPDHTEKGPGHA
jgi:hypothetical protein